MLPAFHQSIRKRQKTAPKFYFFDAGVCRALEGSLKNSLKPSTSAYGIAFESLVINEIVRLNSYGNHDYKMTYFRTKDDAKIDLVIERPGLPLALVEIKSTSLVNEQNLSTLKRLASEFGKAETFCLSNDRNEKIMGKINVLPWPKGLVELGL